MKIKKGSSNFGLSGTGNHDKESGTVWRQSDNFSSDNDMTMVE
jgi:hypothetical protein